MNILAIDSSVFTSSGVKKQRKKLMKCNKKKDRSDDVGTFAQAVVSVVCCDWLVSIVGYTSGEKSVKEKMKETLWVCLCMCVRT